MPCRAADAGTLYVLEPECQDLPDAPIQTHGLDPVSVLRLVRSLGGSCPPVRVVGCEPASIESEDGTLASLSPPVAAAVEEAMAMILCWSGNTWAAPPTEFCRRTHHERQPFARTRIVVHERRPSRGEPVQQQPGMSTLSWVAVAVAAYTAYRMLPSLVRYLRIERM